MKFPGPAIAVAIALTLCGCGGDSSSEPQPPSNTPASPAEASEREQPEVTPRHDTPPDKLVHRDLIVGTGAKAAWNKRVVVNYVGYDYETGEVTGNSWEAGRPSKFDLESVLTIKGLREGMVGMRAGGRREVIIPPELAFGAHGAPPEIPPGATVVYVVDLLEVEPAQDR